MWYLKSKVVDLSLNLITFTLVPLLTSDVSVRRRSLRVSLLSHFDPRTLAIVMEYAAGGELFERFCNAGRFSEEKTIQRDTIVMKA
ncbi:hypothetical protein K1719_027506 [Acacia pycnantha]|nr:hypothetical protein K1719_027506 [Acacia pycnantha]